MINVLNSVKFATTGPDMLSTYVNSISTVDTKTNITVGRLSGRLSTEENTKGLVLIKTSEKVEKPKK